jgi:enterochelin esterase-like enzyme
MMRTQRAKMKIGESYRGITICSLKDRADPKDFVLFCSDGQSTEAFASEYFRARSNNSLWFVGADCSNEHRNVEYVVGRDSPRFEEHELFFTQTLLEWTESTIGIHHDRDRAAVFGYSCGGAFAASMGIRNPEKYGAIFAFSIAGRPIADFEVEPSSSVADVNFYFRSGSREPGGMRSYMARLGKWLTRAGSHVDISVNPGGHEFALWSNALNDSIEKQFQCRRTLF